MRTRGPDSVMFPSDHPLPEIDKCVGDLADLDLPSAIVDGYVLNNAERLFFSAG
jgi:predicted TIM-barrel fold metal-dependent hydrolase